MDSQKAPLDLFISVINENYKGSFTDADKVLVDTLRKKLKTDKKFRKAVKGDGQQIEAYFSPALSIFDDWKMGLSAPRLKFAPIPLWEFPYPQIDGYFFSC